MDLCISNRYSTVETKKKTKASKPANGAAANHHDLIQIKSRWFARHRCIKVSDHFGVITLQIKQCILIFGKSLKIAIDLCCLIPPKWVNDPCHFGVCNSQLWLLTHICGHPQGRILSPRTHRWEAGIPCHCCPRPPRRLAVMGTDGA